MSETEMPWRRYQTPGDHPYSNPGDGRTECPTCGKWVHVITHSCKGIPATESAWRRRFPTEPTR